MASQEPLEGDPLVAALPPATDYMTYLTLLEYQLTPQNLSTLSRLLGEDDGTLAKEIGWDLLKLVLRLLNDNPKEANRSLEIIARRGNPREVVVRVAEELEKLGDADDELDELDELDERDSENGEEDDLPTFAGEAPRVHLGAMTLDGMPPAKPKTNEPPVEARDDDQVNPVPFATRKALKLQSLLNMLGILHPRIKTQYPSRFLATSLPAALGAYRSVPITTATTISFLDVLEKVAGKSRPPLPPRTSTAQIPTASASGEVQPPPTSTAPLPDPEAKAEQEETGVNMPSQDEKAIIFRLLQAVLLEILDEYLSSLSNDKVPCMSWTSRLRETLEPKRVLPNRITEGELFANVPELKDRETVLAKINKLSLDLGFDVASEVKKLVHTGDEAGDVEEDVEEEPSEYPTSPAQIPLPRAGVIFLYAYEFHIEANDVDSLLSTAAIAQLIDHSSPLSASPSIPSAAILDSLFSLLYRRVLKSPHTEQTSEAMPQLSPAKFLLLLSTLTQLFTITPWSGLRDSSHHIATKLLHAYPQQEVRVQAISQTIEGSTLSTNWAELEEEPVQEPGIDEETGLTRSTSALQPHPIPLAPPQQLGVLKAVGVDWLKDEFAIYLRDQKQSMTHGLSPDLLANTDPLPESKSSKPLLDLLFPNDLSILDASTSASANPSEAEGEAGDMVLDFLLEIPFYISTLNILTIILPVLISQDAKVVLERANSHVNSLGSSLAFLAALLQHVGTQEGPNDNNDDSYLNESRADINALQDAFQRVKAILPERTATA